MAQTTVGREAILDAALGLAQASSWDGFQLQQIADRLDISLATISQHYRSKDDLVEAFFDRADQHMLQAASEQTLDSLDEDERLHHCIMFWFEFLAPYKPLVRAMLAYKLESGHIHLQAHGITRISRTVQWFLAAAKRDYTGLQRIADEVAVTGSYLTSFARFCTDNSRDHQDTRQLLQRLLRCTRKGHQLFSGRIKSSDGNHSTAGNGE